MPEVRVEASDVVVYELASLSLGNLHCVERSMDGWTNFKLVFDGFSGSPDEPKSLVWKQAEGSS
jgi:hypothetical protein